MTVTITADKTAYLKWMSLVVLIAQTTALVLLFRYANTHQSPDEHGGYVNSTVVFCSEVIKFITCLGVLFFNANGCWRRFTNEFNRDVFKAPADTLKVGVPALCYVVQNNLLFYALSKLDAATYQVTYQLKILTTAFFAVLVLKQKLIALKWIALIFLTIGVALVQLAQDQQQKASSSLSSSTDDENAWNGFFALLAACFLSGFSGIYMEKLLKHTNVSLWMRNAQLSFFSIFGAFFMVWLYDYERVHRNGFFKGYSWIIWTVVLLQAYGGLLISLVVKFADNILKGFAVSLSIVLSGFVSSQFIGDFSPSFTFFVGASTVIASSFLYGYEPKNAKVFAGEAAPLGIRAGDTSSATSDEMSHDSLKKLAYRA